MVIKTRRPLRLQPISVVLFVLLVCVGCNRVNDDKSGTEGEKAGNSDEDGFVQIFDGETLKNWDGDTAYWSVEEGKLVGQITPEKLLKTNSFIIWRGGETKDFELKTEFRITENGNSGINYRSEQLTDIPNALRGYQADIDGAIRYTGQNYEERARTTLAYRGEIVLVNGAENPSATLKDNIKSN